MGLERPCDFDLLVVVAVAAMVELGLLVDVFFCLGAIKRKLFDSDSIRWWWWWWFNNPLSNLLLLFLLFLLLLLLLLLWWSTLLLEVADGGV